MNNKSNFIEYIESEFKNINKLQCRECMEADERMFKIIRVSKDFKKTLEKFTYYLCRFHAREIFPHYFKSNSKNKSKAQLEMFEVKL